MSSELNTLNDVMTLSINNSASLEDSSASPHGGGNSSGGMVMPDWMEVVYGTILSALFLVIVISSVLVLLVVATNSRLHSLPGYLMAALAICDLIMAITSIIPSVLTIIWDQWLFAQTGCYMQAYCQTYFGTLESSFIMLCALDRFSAIRSPLFYNQLEIYVLRYLKLILVITVVINLPIPTAAAIIATSVTFNPQFSHCVFSFDGSFVVPFLNYVLQYIVPGLVIIFCYSYIAVAAFRSKKEHLKAIRNVEISQKHSEVSHKNNCKISDQSNCSNANDVTNTTSSSVDNSHSFFRHLKLCKMLFIITFVYILSFLPIFVYGFLVAFGVLPFNIYLYKVIHFLTYINGAFNALLYYTMSVAFKQGFHRTLSRFCPALSNPASAEATEAVDANGATIGAAGQVEMADFSTSKRKKRGFSLLSKSNKRRPKIELDV